MSCSSLLIQLDSMVCGNCGVAIDHHSNPFGGQKPSASEVELLSPEEVEGIWHEGWALIDAEKRACATIVALRQQLAEAQARVAVFREHLQHCEPHDVTCGFITDGDEGYDYENCEACKALDVPHDGSALLAVKRAAVAEAVVFWLETGCIDTVKAGVMVKVLNDARKTLDALGSLPLPGDEGGPS